MKHVNDLQRHHAVLKHLSLLPKRIVLLHCKEQEHHNISDFVLHDFCDESCFDFNKAAYFVDNPDFNYLKGISGISKEDGTCSDHKVVWEDPDEFIGLLKKSPFNKKVRSIEQCSLQSDDMHKLQELAEQLSFHNYDYCTWQMKHGNRGILLFEKHDNTEPHLVEEHLPQCVYLLSLCPVC